MLKMPKMPRVPKPVLLVALAVAAVGGGVLIVERLGQVQQLERALAAKEMRVNQLEAQNSNLSRRLDSLEQERTALDDKVTSLRTELRTAAEDVDRSRAALKELQATFDDLTQERAKAQARILQLDAQRNALMERAKGFEQEKQELGRSVERWRSRFALLEREHQQLADKVKQLEAAPLPGLDAVTLDGNASTPSLVGQDPPAASSSSAPSATLTPETVELLPVSVATPPVMGAGTLEGRILVTDQAQGFVVINKGARDGLAVGMRVEIFRGNKSLGRATVVSVRPQLSACDVVHAEPPESLQVGDRAVVHGS